MSRAAFAGIVHGHGGYVPSAARYNSALDGYDQANSIAPHPDGGFVAAGSCVGGGLLMKFDASGTLLWSKQVAGLFGFFGVAANADGTIIAVALTNSLGAGGFDALLTKFSAAGALIWAHSIGDAGNDIAWAVAIDPNDGSIVLGGTTNSFGLTNANGFLLKFDADGALLWANSYPMAGSTNDTINAVAINADGTIIAAGYTFPAGGPTSYDWVLLKFDAAGALIWAKTYGTAAFEQPSAVAIDPNDGTIVAAGRGGSFSMVIKVAANGDLVWADSFNEVGQRFSSCAINGDGTIFLGGFDGSDTDNIVIAKLDAVGALLFGKVYGDLGAPVNSDGYAMIAPGGRPIITGDYTLDNYNTSGVPIYRIEADGSIAGTGDFVEEWAPTVTPVTPTVTAMVPVLTPRAPTVTPQAPAVAPISMTKTELP